MIKDFDEEVDALAKFQEKMQTDAGQESSITKPLDIEGLFAPFENLIEKDRMKIFQKKVKPVKNEIKEENEDSEEG